jgi:metal-sulfur cluster biosynthetic enzyme
VIEALKEIYDPEIPVNIYDLGLIYGVEISPDSDAKVSMTLTTPNCPVPSPCRARSSFAWAPSPVCGMQQVDSSGIRPGTRRR